MKLKVKAILDPYFEPMSLKVREFKNLKEYDEIIIGVERNQDELKTYKTKIYKEGTGHDDENYRFIERIVKTLLWISGGYKIIIAGSKYLAEKIKDAYKDKGLRDFDLHFMEDVYQRKL